MDKIEELLKTRSETEERIENLKTAVTILFTDIRGSTSFFSTEGDVEGIAMIHRHNSLLFPVIKKFHGRVVKTIGDAIMAAFEKPENAILAADAMQKALSVDNEHRALNQQIHIRIGMHSGKGLMKEHDVYGDVVNTASRLESAVCEPDQIVISESTRLQLGPSFDVKSLGSFSIRGQQSRVEAFEVLGSSDTH